MNITKDFTFKEFEVTDDARFAVANTIASFEVRDAVVALAKSVLQPLRDAWGKPLYINSGYRCAELNASVGGVPSSQHRKGEAADVCPYGCRNGKGDISKVVELARTAKRLRLPYDQMILYPSFVHFSHKLTGEQRGQILYAKTYKGPTI